MKPSSLIERASITIGLLFVCVSVGKAQDTVKGAIITYQQDTISCLIHKFKKRDEARIPYHEVLIRDSLGITKKFYPKDIYAYIKDNVMYKSANFYGDHIFMKLMVEGRVVLYHYAGDEAEGEKYIFKRSEEKELTVMNSGEQFTKIIGFNPGMSTDSWKEHTTPFTIKNKNNAFISFFTEYFKDCLVVVSKIKMEFYTSADLPEIFREYNQVCGSKPVIQN